MHYPNAEDMPTFVHGASAHAAQQASYFDDAVDDDFEVSRPFSGPRLYRWLIEDKFRRVARIPLAGRTVLVVCGGSGMDAELLHRHGALVVTSDISVGAARRARERARQRSIPIISIVADATRLPFADGAFDIVYIHDGLHHLEDPARGIAEMARVASRSVCITEPAAAAATSVAVRLGISLDHEDAGNQVSRLHPADVAGQLGDLGFEVVHLERYAMRYRHEPGLLAEVLSRPVLFGITKGTIKALNFALGAVGNKLAVVAVRR